MRSVTIFVLLAFAARTHAKDTTVNEVVDHLVDILSDEAFEAPTFPHASLENLTLGSPAKLTTSSCGCLRPLVPVFKRGGATLPWSQQLPQRHATMGALRHPVGVDAPMPACDVAAGMMMPKTPALAIGAAVTAALYIGAKRLLDTPSREYVDGQNTVGGEYDAWTEEGVLEYYWGEHIHLGFYTDAEREAGYKKKDFITAKFDFVDEMFKWGTDGANVDNVKRVLDVGCGIGGTSRHLAKKLVPHANVTGITLSPKQVARATQLAKDQGIPNANFQVMNALEMEFPDNSFDLVWACESGEHMPDKTKYVNEMLRVLKPGGKLMIATWCQRDNLEATKASGGALEDLAKGGSNLAGFTDDEKKRLDFLYREWAHPYFISYEEYARICERSGVVSKVQGEDWVKETLPSWRHSIWVGVWDPWIVVFKGPRIWYKTVREIVTLERMHRAFRDGLLTYGMVKATKA